MSDDGLHPDPYLVLDPGRHTAPIRRLDADREGRFLVTASHDKTVRVWAAADGRLLRTLRLPAGPGFVGRANAAAISPDGTLVAAGGWLLPGDDSIYLFDRASGRLLRRVGGLPDAVFHLAFSPDGSRLAATLGGRNGVRLIDPASGRVVAEDKGYGSQSYGAAFDAAGRLATTSYDGKLRLYDPAGQLLRTEPAPGGRRPFGLAFSPDGRRLAVGYDDGTRVDLLDGASLKPLLTPDGTGVGNGDLSKIAWSADGASLYAAGRWQVGGEYRLRRWPEGGRGAPVDVALSRSTVMSLRPLPEGRLAFAAADPRLGVLGGDGRERWSLGPAGGDFRNQRDLLAVAADGVLVRFGYEPFGRSPALLRLAERRLVPEGSAEGLAAPRVEAPGLAVEGWENGTEPTLNGKPLALDAYEMARSLAIAPDGQRFVLGSDWSLRLFDRAGKEVWRRAVPGTVWAATVSGDGRLVVAAYGDGTIRWHRLGDGQELLAFYPDGDRERWVLWTQKGYYDASPGAEELIGWQVNRGRDEAPEFFTASRFRDQFHWPDVIDLVLKELDVDRAVEKAGLANVQAVMPVGIPATSRSGAAQIVTPAPPTPSTVLSILPPTVAIIEPQDGAPVSPGELIIRYTVTGPEHDPPATVKALLDGERAGEMTFLPGATGARERRLIVEVQSGATLLTLMARNAQGWSDPVSVRFGRAWAPSKAPAIVHQPAGTLYALAVGINQYERYPNLALNFAAADAEDLCNALLPQEGHFYKHVRVRPLVDANATWEEVLEGFEWLKRDMTAEDAAIVLLSGHGMNDPTGAFHFLPHDANIGKPLLQKRTCIGYDYLKDSLRTLADRGKTLLFLDACHSGGVIPDTKSVPTDLGAVASDLAQAENGVIVFASCTGGQVSLEKQEWQNGALTEALLEALSGKARRDDDRLRVSDIADYVTPRVKQLTGGAQTPVILFPRGRYTNPPVYLLR